MSKWLNKFLDTGPRNSTDNTDRFKSETNMSVLSVHPQGHLDQNLENISRINTDNTDRFKSDTNMSVLSVPSQRLLDQDYFYSYEERIAIAEVDGNQNPTDAHCIAYLDAFISILSAFAEDDPHQDWLAQKIQTALATLEVQNFPTLN